MRVEETSGLRGDLVEAIRRFGLTEGDLARASLAPSRNWSVPER